MNRLSRTLAALFLAASAAGCSGPATPARAPLEGVRIGGAFRLINQNGDPIGDADLFGFYHIMYFGYTFCPDVCPTDLQTIGAGLRLFEARDARRGARVIPVFVTVDPKRDTPAVLKPYVAAFHSRMIGLTGTPAQTAALARAYGVAVELGKPNAEGGYLVAHGRFAFLMDPEDKPVALLPEDKTPQDVADELDRWVK